MAEPDLERRLVTPEGVMLHLRLATAGARAGAFLVDWLIIIGILIAMTLMLMLAGWALGGSVLGPMLVLWLLGFFLLRNFYFVLFESGPRTATPGKRWAKLRVVARDGRLRGGAVLARNMMREIEVFLPLMMLSFGAAEGFVGGWTVATGLGWSLLFLFFPLFNRDRMRAGDLVAGTWVVETQRARRGDDLLAHADGSGARHFTTEELAVYGAFELQRLEDVLRRNDGDAITIVAAAVRRKIGRNEESNDLEFLNLYYTELRLELERKLLLGKRKLDKFDTVN